MTSNNSGDFHRALGPFSTSALVAGSIIGTGIFLFASEIAANLRDARTILLAWLTGAVIAGCGALCLAELAATYPRIGGLYYFLHRAYGPPVSFLYAWSKFLIMRVGSFAIFALFFAKYSLEFIGFASDESDLAKLAVAVGAIAVLTVINIVGVRTGAVVQVIFTVVKILCLVGIVGVAVAFSAGTLTSHEIEPFKPVKDPTEPPFLLFGAALVAILWTYGGWDESPFVAEEVRNPKRNLPFSILGGLTVAAALYLLVNGAYLAILSPIEMASAEGKTAIIAMHRAAGPRSGSVLSLALMISTFGAANGMALTGARIAYAAGRDHPLFQWFSHTHERFKTPVRALLAQGLLAAIATVVLPNPMILLYFTGLAYWIFAALMAVAVFILRRREPHQQRPFRVWGYPLTPAIFFLACVGMAYSTVAMSRKNTISTIVILITGAVVFTVQTRVASSNR